MGEYREEDRSVDVVVETVPREDQVHTIVEPVQEVKEEVHYDIPEYVPEVEQVAEIEEDEEEGVFDYVLKYPLTFEAEKYERITFNFESLTGRDIKEAARHLTPAEATGLAETNKSFLASLAAKSAGLPVELMDEISAKDFSEITIKIQGFLLN